MTKFPVLIALITVMSFAFSHQSAAQNATRCINLGSNSNSKTLRNTCNRKVEIIWCHNSSKRGVKSGRCGRKGKVHQKHSVLKPGQIKSNRYSLPRGARISHGACFGGYYSTKTRGSSRSFTCK